MSLVEPMIPAAEHSGRPRHVNMREVLNAIFYVLSTGRQRRTLPNAAQKYGALLLSNAISRYARPVAERGCPSFRALRPNRRRFHPPRNDIIVSLSSLARP